MTFSATARVLEEIKMIRGSEGKSWMEEQKAFHLGILMNLNRGIIWLNEQVRKLR